MELPNFTLNIWGGTDDELVQQVNTDREEKTQGNEYAQFRKFFVAFKVCILLFDTC